MKPADDASPAAWIVERLTTFAENVGSIVPDVFEAYARVFHPAGKDVDDGWAPVRWGEIARLNQKLPHSEMQFADLVPKECFDDSGRNWRRGQPGLWDWPPDEETMPDGLLKSLLGILRGFTSTPEKCFFAYWDGWGDPTPMWPRAWTAKDEASQDAERRRYETGEIYEGTPRGSRDQAPKFSIPGRDYYLFAGHIEEVTTEWDGLSGQLPTMWWPEDHAWFVHTEIDFDTTYLGGGRSCLDALLADPAIEALETKRNHKFGQDSESINRRHS